MHVHAAMIPSMKVDWKARFFRTHAEEYLPSQFERVAFTVAAGIGVGLVIWIATWAGNRHPSTMDFLVFWTAGGSALHGLALSVYNPYFQHASEIAAVGHPFSTALPWSYPPQFLFVAVALCLMSFPIALAIWNLSTLLFYSVAVSITSRRPAVFFASWGLPWVPLDLGEGQTGLLTAALLAFFLLNLEGAPVLSGLVLGLLTFKPQIGVLIPLALIAGGYWRALTWGCVWALLWIAISSIVFGTATIAAFIHTIGQDSTDYLVGNGIGWNKLQSIYGLARWLGVQNDLAWVLQMFATGGCAIAIGLLWRSKSSFCLKAAGLSAAAALATPYVLAYDLTVLSVAIAFLIRHRAFTGIEFGALAVTPLSFLGFSYPVGLIASVALLVVVCSRALHDVPNARADNRECTEPSERRSDVCFPAEESHPIYVFD